jgi:hypothetical protein
LEQRTAELVGAQLHGAIHDHGRHLFFDEFVRELVDAAHDQVWLLAGLASITLAESGAVAALGSARTTVADEQAVPAWVSAMPQIAPTGEMWRMRDLTGTRYAVIARFGYPDAEPSAFLFDVDASEFVMLAGAGDFDEVEQAVAAWRAAFGDAAGDAVPEPVGQAGELLCLVHCDLINVIGNESRPVMDNWLRATRRMVDLVDEVGRRGMRLSNDGVFSGDFDVTLMTEPFDAWYCDRYGEVPDAEAVEELAVQWMETTLAETWFGVSPGRVRTQIALIGDWVEDDQITIEVKALLPEWVRWLGERAALPEPLHERNLAAAALWAVR